MRPSPYGVESSTTATESKPSVLTRLAAKAPCASSFGTIRFTMLKPCAVSCGFEETDTMARSALS